MKNRVETLATVLLGTAEFSGCRRAPRAGLFSYRRGKDIPLDFLLVDRLGAPVLAATARPVAGLVLFDDYPGLSWILDTTQKPPRLLGRSHSLPLETFVPGWQEPDEGSSWPAILAAAAGLVSLLAVALLLFAA